MKVPHLTAKTVKETNRRIYNQISIEEYNRNPSIFDNRRQIKIKEILRRLSRSSKHAYFVDIGCGTGNVLKLAREFFSIAVGTDIAADLLKKVKQEVPELLLCAADAEHLPFKKEAFDCLSYYGTLHHMINPLRALHEGYYLLKPAGYLYTDHDPNYFFGRFYHRYYQLRYRKRPGFESTDAEIAEYHHTQSPGLDPEYIKDGLRKMEFHNIELYYRHTSNSRLSAVQQLALAILKLFSYLFPFRSFYTHFFIIACK